MKLANPFLPRVRNLYLYVYACGDCGRSGRGLELHHIKGRVSDSAFNATPLCLPCHAAIQHTDEEHKRLFKKNAKFLYGEDFSPTVGDLQFLRDNPELVDGTFTEWLFSLAKR